MGRGVNMGRRIDRWEYNNVLEVDIHGVCGEVNTLDQIKFALKGMLLDIDLGMTWSDRYNSAVLNMIADKFEEEWEN